MRIWAGVVWLLTLVIVGIDALAVAAAPRPNVLLIAVDDMNNDLACYGHPLVKSPNIDRLAKRGVRFDRAYCQYPLCNPSRVSMLSGRRPDTTRVMDLETPPRSHLKDVVFLPQYFRQQGYHAAHIGKIFHTGEAFEDSPSWNVEIRETGKNPPPAAIILGEKVDRPAKYNIQWAVLNTPDEETPDGRVARQACKMLTPLAADKQPFFLAVGFRRPHQPYAASQKYFDMYPLDSIPPLDEPAEHLQHIPAPAFTFPPGTPQLPEAQRRQIVAAYYACITYVDAQIGLLLDTLDALKLWDNTVVVFYSDHGYHLGEHGGMWHKMSLFEASARVPMIVAAPGMQAGQPCPRVVELLDVYPTLVDLCGLASVAELEGRSLRPLLENPNAAWPDVAWTQVRRGEVTGRSVRTPRWRYTEWDEGRAGAELYDYQTDPGEHVNLAADERFAPRRAELKKLLDTRGHNKDAPTPAAN